MTSSYDLLTGFKGSKTGFDWAKSFRATFPDAVRNNVVVVPGEDTISVKIGSIDKNGVMQNPDVYILLETDPKGKWRVNSFCMREDSYREDSPKGRMINLMDALAKEKSPCQLIGQLIDTKASGGTLYEALSKADHIRNIAGYIDNIEAGKIEPLVVNRVNPITVILPDISQVLKHDMV